MEHGLEQVVVVGASLAGLRAAETLRGLGFEGTITMLSDEAHMPYDRPPLSKQVLSGKWEPERAALRRPDVIDGLGLTWRLGVAAASLDTAGRHVGLATDEVLHFDGLIIATGASPRRLPPTVTGQVTAAGPAVMELRTLDDAVALHARLAAGGQRVVVIGAGFIGLEVAATARSLGNEVTVVEAAEAPLIRGLGAEMGRAIAMVHEDHGTHVRCGEQVHAIDDHGVLMHLGHTTERLPADVVVVGIGVHPNTRWLEGSGVHLDDGVVCDEFLNVGIPGVYAAGDVVRWPHPLFGETMRIEHWSNAAEQGALAARNLMIAAGALDEEPTASDAVPFFWSDQYEHRIQFLGRAGGVEHEEIRVVAGSPDERSFVALYGAAGRLRGVLGLNRPKQVMPYRRLLAERIGWDAALEYAAEQQAGQAQQAQQTQQ